MLIVLNLFKFRCVCYLCFFLLMSDVFEENMYNTNQEKYITLVKAKPKVYDTKYLKRK